MTRKSFAVLQIFALVFLSAAPLSVLFLAPQKAEAAIGFVQKKVTENTGAAATALTFDDPSTSGNLIVVVLGLYDGGATISSVVDNKGNTFSPAQQQQGISDLNDRAEIWYKENANGDASHEITVNGTGTFYGSVVIAEFSGIATASALDTHVGDGNHESTVHTEHSVSTGTLAQSDELVIAVSAFRGENFDTDLSTPAGFVVSLPEREAWLTDLLKTWRFTD